MSTNEEEQKDDVEMLNMDKFLVKENYPELKLFENIASDDLCVEHHEKCLCLDRVVAALKYYQFLVLSRITKNHLDNPKEMFGEFCDKYYPKHFFLDDYIHWISHHKSAEQTMAIRERLHFVCDSAKLCGAVTRHYRDRRADGGGDDATTNWYTDVMDAIHFNLYHLEELGLRTQIESIDCELASDDEKRDDRECVNDCLKKMIREVDSKRNTFRTGRLDVATNSKFNLQVAMAFDQDTKVNHDGKHTKMEHLIKDLLNRVQKVERVKSICQFIETHEFDTDCIADDITIFVEDIKRSVYGKPNIIDHISTIWRQQRVLSKTFATGLPLFYWERYHSVTAEDMAANWPFSLMDLEGHSPRDLSVEPHFGDLREEVTETGLLSPKKFEDLVVKKAARYLDTAQCRRMKSGRLGDKLFFDIPEGSSLTPQHLQTIILYCDFTELCTLFSLSMRKNESDDGHEKIRERNGKFYYFSKRLRELVTCFGIGDFDRQKRSYFSGVSKVLNIGQFNIGFNTPTSTSRTKEIALIFAGEGGMLLTVDCQREWDKWVQPVFDTTWISAFVEEDEYLWFGNVGAGGLELKDIAIMASARVYRQSLHALYLFDAALCGRDNWSDEFSQIDLKILIFCIKHVIGENVGPPPNGVDEYVLENMYSFTQQKHKIWLHPKRNSEDNRILNDLLFSVFYGEALREEIAERPDFHPNLFKLFPNLVELEYQNGHSPVKLTWLLSLFDHSVIPQSFERLKVSAFDNHAVQQTFDDIPDMKERFAAKGFAIDVATIPARYSIDSIIIKRLQ